MKLFLFFILLFLLLSCKDEEHKENLPEFDSTLIPDKRKEIVNDLEKQNKKRTDSIENKRLRDSINEFELPYYTEDDSGYFRDSGYFKGTGPGKINYSEETRNTLLESFLSKNLSREDINFLNKCSLSHSVYIDKKKIRLDTLKNTDATIISVYRFRGPKSQTISINGNVVRKFTEKENRESTYDILTFHQSSFRRFTFKEKEFYFFTGSRMDCGATSGCLPIIYLLYDVKNKKLKEFCTFRVDEAYFFGDVNGDNQIDYLELENDGGYGSPIDRLNHYEIRLYSCNPSGKFVQQKDTKRNEYFIRGNSGIDFYVGDQMYIDEYYWPVKLKK